MTQRGSDRWWVELTTSLLATFGSLVVLVYAYELQSSPSTTPPFGTWLWEGMRSCGECVTSWRTKLPTIPRRVRMTLPVERSSADDAEDSAVASWRAKTGAPERIAAETERAWRTVVLRCPSCDHAQLEVCVAELVTRVMRCGRCGTIGWVEVPS